MGLMPVIRVLDLDDLCENDCVIVLGYGDVDLLASQDVLGLELTPPLENVWAVGMFSRC